MGERSPTAWGKEFGQTLLQSELSAADFDDLYRQYRGHVYRAVRGIVLDGPTAEDLTQDAFQKAWCRRSSFRGESTPLTWLYRIAVHGALSHVRRRKILALALPKIGLAPAGTDLNGVENRSVVEAAMSTLTAKQRAVIVLLYHADLSREEVARVLGIPPGTVASRQAAAIVAMRSFLTLRGEANAHC
jgi:RNA polymerase sigma factor (sigma-70 family)